VSGGAGATHFALIGPGRLDGTTYEAPARIAERATATVVAATPDGVGSVAIPLAPWPRQDDDLIAVATYDDGVAFHRATDGALLGVLALDGGVADVAQLGQSVVAPSTTAGVLWSIDLATGVPHAIDDVPAGNEVAGFRGDAYVTNRDVHGDGALTRVRDGSTLRIRTGVTAEGLAIDPATSVAYVANVNDASIAVIDVPGMRLTRRLSAPVRPFSVALDRASHRLDVVSNVPQTPTSPGGHVESLDLATGRVLAHSAAFRFPLGVALDARRRRLFVTDEADGTVAVLDARSLRPLRRPLPACAVPWRPTVDQASSRLYVPCARTSALAAYDLRTLAPLPGSPYATGGYPLAVSVLRRGTQPQGVRDPG